MPDIGDERLAYREALRRAEEAALQGVTPQELTTSLETPEGVLPELEGAESIVDEAAEPAPPVEPVEAAVEADTSAQEPEPEVVDSIETLREQLAAAQARLEEKDSFIGRQSTEIGELRHAVEQIQAQVQVPSPPNMMITQGMIDENPAQAVHLAYQQQNEQALAIAYEAWKEEDPWTAGQWLTDRRLEQERANREKELADIRAELEAVRVPQRESEEQAAWRSAITSVGEHIPGFEPQEAARLLEEVAPQFPAIANMIATGDTAAKVQGLTLLYAQDRAAKSVPVEEAQQVAAEAAREAADSAAAARAAASVVPQSTVGEGAGLPELSPSEAEAQRYVERLQNRVSLDRGWTGRTPGR